MVSMLSTKSQPSEAKQVESMQQDPSALSVPREAPPSYNEVNSVPDSAKDNPVPADQAPLVPSAYNQSVNFPIMSSPSQNKEQHQPIVRQPEMNSEKCVQLQTCKNERDRKRDDDDNCCSSFCNLCCMETCSCMVMCLGAAANSLQCIIACLMCSELCQ